MTTEKATFGAGCFWGVELSFRKLSGVIDATVGYEGGNTTNPTYEDICHANTGHAEVVEIDYDPNIISYLALLNAFFKLHNPTTLNRQGPDTGNQYRSAIFTHNQTQADTATELIDKLNTQGNFTDPIVTEVTPATTFYRAEEYHQQYLVKNGQDRCGL